MFATLTPKSYFHQKKTNVLSARILVPSKYKKLFSSRDLIPRARSSEINPLTH